MHDAGVMIDRPGSADRDDAVWVVRDGEGWRAWVHIADVSREVRLGGNVDVEACRRGESRYLPDRTIPMLPRAIQAAAALRAGAADLPTFGLELRVNPAGELTGCQLGPGRLRTAVEASYEEATAALGEPGHPLSAMLRDAHDLARTLLARRRAAGALAVYDLLRGWATDEDGTIVALAVPERNAGYVIVQELMIAANEAAARWAVERDLPILFRNHRAGTADRADLADQLAIAEGAGDRLDTIRQHLAMVLRPAVYEPRVGGHFGLNLPAYTHVTSPLRRYPDLVNQRILLAAAAGRPSPYLVDTLDETAAAVNLRAEGRRARKAAALRDAAHQQTRAQLAEDDYRSLDERTFSKLVRLAAAEDRFSPALAAEIGQRVDAGGLLPRDAAGPLFEARGAGWRPVRERLLRWLAAEPAHALTLLALHSQQAQLGEVRWEEQPVGTVHQPMFTARAWLGEQSSPLRRAPAKRLARQQAALALVAALAGLPDPSTDLTGPEPPPAPSPRARAIPADHPPAMAINELAQVGQLTDLHWSYTSDGSPHEPTHTCTVSACWVATGQMHTGTGTGATKSTAKAAAATALWDALNEGQG